MHVFRFALRAAGMFAAVLTFSISARGQHYTTYDLVVPTDPSLTPSVIDGTGRLMPTNRSYIIGVEGGVRGTLVFTNWTATNPNYPVIIVNKHGTGRVVIKDNGVTFRDGIRLDNCAFVKLLGNNDPAHRYGFEVAQAGRVPSPGVSRVSRLGVSAGATSTNIEIAFIEVHHTGFAGIMAKTDPSLTKPETWAANYTMYDLSVHDCYIHDVGGEGMYIGYTGWSTDHWPDVPGFESHEILGLKVYNNLIERTQWDGFQIASTPDLATAVFNNVVIDSGLQGEAGQSNGVQIGAGSSGRFHDNIIINSVGNNLAMFGRGYNAIYNNLMVNGDNAVFTDNRPNPVPADPNWRQTIPGSYYSFYHNTIINPAQHAFWSMSEVTITNFKNNLSVVPNLEATDAFANNGASINTAGNLLLRSLDGAGFADPANYDYRLVSGASAIDAGVSLAAADVPVTTDFQGLTRPQGATPDAGFAEAGPLSVFLIAYPPAGDGATGSINASTLGGTPPYSYAWSTGATSAAISGLGEGLYRVTVTDALGARVTRATYLIPGATMGAPVSVAPENQVHEPEFDAPGGTYLTTQSVAITSETAGASIRYTLDGTNPSDSAGALYSGPLTVDSTATVKAIAYKTGMDNSTVATATYVIDNGPPNTKFDIALAAVTASSFTSTNYPANVLDGDFSTSWGSNGDGHWIQFELGESKRIGFINLATTVANARSYTFDLLASNDGSSWTPLLIGASTAFNLGLQKFDITDVEPVRYLRLVGHGSTYSPTLNGYTEIEIWGGPTTGVSGPPPAAPSNLTAVAGDAQVTLSWSAASGATGYNVQRATTSDGPYTTVAAGLTSTHYTNTGLTNGTPYYYVVSAVNLFGTSADSNETSATPQGLPPAPPSSVSATAGDGHVVVNWSTSAKATSYNLKRATTLGGPYATTATGLVLPTFTDTGLTNGTTYHYVVSGVNIDGEGADSAPASATPQAGYAGVWHIITPLAWGPATGSGYCPATYAFDQPPTWDAQAQAPVGNDIAPHQSTLTEYMGRFWYMDLGPDYASMRITQMWTRYRPSSGGTYNGFALMWWDDDKDTINDGISVPEMNFSAGGTIPHVNSQLWVRDRDFSSAPVTPQGRYLVVSTGSTVSGRPNEFAIVGYRDTAAPPAPPTGLTATPSSGGSVVLSWSASLGADRYIVKRATTSGGPYAIVADDIVTPTYTDTGLEDGTTYRYVVAAANARGTSAPSAEASVIADALPPTIHQLTASRTELWPANHRMVSVSLTVVVADTLDPAPRTSVIAVESNEPVLGMDDGDTSPDWEITGDLTVNLRAERSGVGTGRIYTLTLESRDEVGNASAKTVTVTVPVSASTGG